MSLAPVVVGVAKVEIRQRTANGDMADAKRRRGKLHRLLFEAFEDRPFAHCGADEMGIGRLRPHALIAQQYQQIQKSIAEGLAPQRNQPRLVIGRKQLWRVFQLPKRIEIFADHRQIVDHGAVVEHQRRYFRQRVVLHQLRMRL